MIIYILEVGRCVYFGQTRKGLKSRVGRHLWDLKKNQHQNPVLQSAYNKHQSFSSTLLEEHANQSDCDLAEQFYISYFRFLGAKVANSRTGGYEGSLLSKEARRKIGIASSINGKGRPMHPNTKAALLESRRGHPISAKHRAAIIKANTGRKKSIETRKRLSKALAGRRLSPAHCAKVAAGHQGRIVPNETREKIRASRIRHNRIYGTHHPSVESKAKTSASLKLFYSTMRAVGAKMPAPSFKGRRHNAESLAKMGLASNRLWELRDRGFKVGPCKLTRGDVVAIRASNLSQTELARQYNVDQTNISLIKRRKTWTNA